MFSRFSIWAAVILGGGFLFVFVNSHNKPTAKELPLTPREQWHAPQLAIPTPEQKARNSLAGIAVGLVGLSIEERSSIEKKLPEKLIPAIKKWAKVYDGRVGFDPDRITMDMFKNRFGDSDRFKLYSFVVDGNTVVVEESNGRYKMYYLSSPDFMQLLKVPHGEAPPVLAGSVTREQVLAMALADSGTTFKPEEVIISPTGAMSSMNGGAMVRVAPLYGDTNNGLCKLDYVFGPDGKLVCYGRMPGFGF